MIASRRDATRRRPAVTLPAPSWCRHTGALRVLTLRHGRLLECVACGRVLEPGAERPVLHDPYGPVPIPRTLPPCPECGGPADSGAGHDCEVER